MAKAFDCASAEQIYIACPLQFASTGTSQHEPQRTTLLDEVVNSVEQRGNALYLVNDEGCLVRVCVHDIDKAFRSRHQGTAYVTFKEIDGICFGKLMRQPERLARAAWPEEEETAVGKTYESLFHGVHDTIILAEMLWEFYSANGKMDAFFPLASEKTHCATMREVA